ncbi:hypothetical protein L1987_77434 [Smallanthus sonchifolius]|uniref:Uncharacterized protein n=1 Tax=Smallanthus sonchifolius TaxID=185202 RepID=A0ACB8Z8Z9_9ASTR|nr:hypothetical protein L1987_77434 [Smallanthus sonchifolius]
MMDTGSSSSSSVAAVDLDHVDLDSWFATFPVDNFDGSVMNSGFSRGQQLILISERDPTYPNEPFMPTVNDCTNLEGGSSNASQYAIAQDMMTMSSLTPSSNMDTMHIEEMMTMGSLTPNNIVNTMHGDELMMMIVSSMTPSSNINTMQTGEMMTMNSLTPSSYINTTHIGEMTTVNSLTPSSSTNTMQNEGILSSAVNFISNISTQSSQPQRNSNLPQYQLIPPAQAPQYQLLLQQVSKGKAVVQPTTYPLANHSNMTFDDQNNQLHYQMPSNQLLPCTGPTVNTQMGNLQYNQALRVQMQQNQNQLQLQQATWSSSTLISEGGRQLRNIINLNLSAPVGFSTPSQFPSSTAFRVYVLRQIRKMKDRYFNELLKMYYNAMELRARATNMEDKINYEKVQTYLERMMTFLNITRVEMVPKNDEMVYNYMNTVINYMSYHMNRPGGSSQQRDPAHQPPRGPQVQPPLGAMNLQNNPSPTLSQRVTNLEASMLNFNQNFPSRRPQLTQLTQQRMPSSLNSTSFQTVLRTTEQINSGPYTSSVIGPGSPISLFSNTTATNFPSHPLNQQPPVANQNFINLEKMKAPMNKTNKPTGSKVCHGTSPLLSGLVNSLPSTVNPITQQTSVSSSRLDVNSMLSPQSIPHSPFLLSSNSSDPSKQQSSGISSLLTVDSQKTKPPMDPPSEEPKTSKDQVKSVSSNTLGSTLTEINSIEKVTHELSVPSVYTDQFVSQGWDRGSTETSPNKKTKIENKWAIFEEIKETNKKLLETSIHVVTDTSVETTVKCLFRNVCFPHLLGPQGGVTSDKMPEFAIMLLVPANYPASSPRIIKSSHNVLNEPWGKLYEEMLTKFDHWLGGVTGILSLGDMARNWDAIARAVMTEFMKERDGKSFTSMYGRWDNCMNSYSTSN